MKELLAKLNLLFKQLFQLSNVQTPHSLRLLAVTKANLGKDLSPREDEFGCAETVNTLCMKAFLEPAGGDLSTRKMYIELLANSKWVRVYVPLPGDIILSPTTYGNGKMANGHVGIVIENGMIASNNSYNSLLEVNYNLRSWRERYGVVGGFPIAFFRKIL